MIKLNRDNAIGFLTKLNEIPKDLKLSKHLLYAISKTKKNLLDSLTDLADKEKALYTEAYTKINTDRRALVESFAEKNEDGTFVVTGKELTFTEEKEALLKTAIEKFDKDNKKAIDVINKAAKALQDYITEVVEIEIVTTSLDNLPDVLDFETYGLLSNFIKE